MMIRRGGRITSTPSAIPFIILLVVIVQSIYRTHKSTLTSFYWSTQYGTESASFEKSSNGTIDLTVDGQVQEDSSSEEGDDHVVHNTDGEDSKSTFFINTTEISSRWGLQSTPQIEQLLLRMADTSSSRLHAFQPEKEFAFFQHLHKSGGTSFSNSLYELYSDGGPNKDYPNPDMHVDSGNTFILPKSRVSGELGDSKQVKSIIDGIKKDIQDKKKDATILNFHVGYSHSGYKAAASTLQMNDLLKYYGSNDDGVIITTDTINNTTITDRRLRAMTFVREPVDHRASVMAMAMCGLNRLLQKKRIKDPDCGKHVNMSAIVDFGVEEIRSKCEALPEKERNQKLNERCKKLERGIDPMPYCRSANALLRDKSIYHKWCSNLLSSAVDEYIDTQDGTIPEMEEYALATFGRPLLQVADEAPLESSADDPVDDDEDVVDEDDDFDDDSTVISIPPRDYIFFGITERMHDSMCLFYYTFRKEPPKKLKGELAFTNRVMSCKTNSWWTDEDKAIVREREVGDYAIWRAANVIMDIWLLRVRKEIIDDIFQGSEEKAEQFLSKDGTSDDFSLPPYIASGCFGF